MFGTDKITISVGFNGIPAEFLVVKITDLSLVESGVVKCKPFVLQGNANMYLIDSSQLFIYNCKSLAPEFSIPLKKWLTNCVLLPNFGDGSYNCYPLMCNIEHRSM